MRRSSALAAAIAILCLTPIALCQMPEKPAPGPEHKKLGFFVGKWTGDGELKANPFMPAGKYTSADTCEWFEGNFAVVCRSEGKGPMGPTKGLGIIGYNGEEKVYTYYGVDNSGMVSTTVSKGTLTGDTWVFTDESKMGGKVVKGRYTMKELSPTSYSFKWEMQGEDGTWAALMEGKQTRAK